MASGKVELYGLNWGVGTEQLFIEKFCIRKGGRWMQDGRERGAGLFHHYRRMQQLLWPEIDHHRWSDLILKTILEERITVVAGARDTGKTHCALARYGLTDYFCFPQETLNIISSTDSRGLEARVFGEIKDLLRQAKDRYPDLPGNVVDAKHAIFTDSLGEQGDVVRDHRKGMIGVPCLDTKGDWVGLEKFAGIKQQRRRLLGDELQFMPLNYLKSIDALDKGDFKGVFTGNMLAQKALDKIAEPECGWDGYVHPGKTTTWRNKFGGVTINLVGTDSPNFDKDKPKNYTYLINQDDIDRMTKRRGRDSIAFAVYIEGIRKSGLNAHVVLTVEMCKKFGAFDKAVWSGEPTIKILGIDAGFGGDACETIFIEMGRAANQQQVIKFGPVEEIPISPDLKEKGTPEDQIANAAKLKCKTLGIPYENVFVEAGMRATLISSMSRIMSNAINPVLAGGPATDRPVEKTLFILDPDTGQKRHKRCDEHYSKFVTEMWYSVRELVESKQAREFPQDAAEEFSQREWEWVSGDRYELESKPEFKERNGYSPNKADATSIAVEGARRLGFVIERMDVPDQVDGEKRDWLEDEQRKHRALVKKQELNYN